MATFLFQLKEIPVMKDGDTADVLVDLGFGIYTPKTVRLKGIDAPETRTLNKREKAAGLKVKGICQKLLVKGTTLLSYSLDGQDEKYGRVLGDFVLPSETLLGRLTQILLMGKLVRAYSGDKKKPWTAEELKLIEDFSL
jgi:endonuclease YncB( thermonuclease family)